MVTVDSQSTSWPVPRSPADLNPASLRHSVEVVAGLRSVEGGGVSDLKLEAWRERVRDARSARRKRRRKPPGAASLARRTSRQCPPLGRHGGLSPSLGPRRTLDPQNWLAVADRAASFVEASCPGEACPDISLAESRAKPADLTAWSWARAIENLILRRPDAALWFIDRVVAAEPDNWTAHAHRAMAFKPLKRSSEATAEYRRVAALTPTRCSLPRPPAIVRFRANGRPRSGCRRLPLTLMPVARRNWPSSRCSHEMTPFTAERRAMLQSMRAGAPAAPTFSRGYGSSLWDPTASTIIAPSFELADSVLAGLATSSEPDQQKHERQHTMLRSRAAILIRSGHPDLALPELDRANALNAFDPYAELLRLIALLRAGKAAEARARKSPRSPRSTLTSGTTDRGTSG